MEANINNDSLNDIKLLINRSIEISAKPLSEKANKKYTKFLFEVDVNWFCHKWENRNKTANFPIEWERWKAYRPLELYSSVFHNKSKISETDFENLEERRGREKLRVNQLDNNRYEHIENWYAIDSHWIYDWKMFVTNKRNILALGSKKSEIEGIGILDPGPISNKNLFDENGNLKSGLVKGKDYRLINENVWNALYDIYSGVSLNNVILIKYSLKYRF